MRSIERRRAGERAIVKRKIARDHMDEQAGGGEFCRAFARAVKVGDAARNRSELALHEEEESLTSNDAPEAYKGSAISSVVKADVQHAEVRRLGAHDGPQEDTQCQLTYRV